MEACAVEGDVLVIYRDIDASFPRTCRQAAAFSLCLRGIVYAVLGRTVQSALLLSVLKVFSGENVPDQVKCTDEI